MFNIIISLSYSLRKNPQYSYYYASQTQTNTNNARSSFYNQTSSRTSRKFPNYVIIGCCTGIALIGVILQVYVIRWIIIILTIVGTYLAAFSIALITYCIVRPLSGIEQNLATYILLFILFCYMQFYSGTLLSKNVNMKSLFSRNMYLAQRKQALEKSKQLAEELETVRANALANGNEVLVWLRSFICFFYI